MSRPRGAWLIRWIWRLYPGRWRKRYGAQLERDLEDDWAEASNRRSAIALAWDAIVTLPRAWIAEISHARLPSVTLTTWGSAWRSLARAPMHAAFVILTLSLALGINASVFSVTWSVLLESLPFSDPTTLVRVEPAPVSPLADGGWSIQQEFLDGPGLESAALYVPGAGANLVGQTEATRLTLTQVDAQIFSLLGVEPFLGRAVGAPRPEAHEAVISHALWTSAFGGDPAVLGRDLLLSGHSVRVVGVAPPDFDFPAGTDAWVSLPTIGDFYPLAAGPSVIGRVESRTALPALTEYHRALTERNWEGAPDYIPRPAVRITYLRDQLLGAIQGPLLALLGAAGAVLVLGCVNLAAVQLARLFHRAGELQVRRALGASSLRVFVQLVAEMGMLALASGAVALAIATLTADALAALLPAGLPGLGHVGLSLPLIGFTAVTAALAALLAGTLPAWQATRWSGEGTGRTTSVDRSRARLQSGLLSVQVALALVLLVGAGLFVRSLSRFAAVPLGYDVGSVLTFGAHLPRESYPDATMQGAWAESAHDALAHLPGVEAAGFGTRLPFFSGMGIGISLRAEGTPQDGEPVSAAWLRVSPGYFEALGIRFLAGGSPTPPRSADDRLGGIVLTRTTALRLFGGAAALGRQVTVEGGNGVPVQVVGVVDDVRLRGRESEVSPVAFGSAEGATLASPVFALRVRGDLAPVVSGIERVLSELDPAVPPDGIRTTADAAAQELATPRAIALLTSLFGAASVALVALGLYGLLTQWVETRRRELGVRLALGASSRHVMVRTVGRALGLIAGGVLVGVPTAMAAARLTRSLLYNVSPSDPQALGAAVGVVLAVGTVASLVPALRASRTSPGDSLKAE